MVGLLWGNSLRVPVCPAICQRSPASEDTIWRTSVKHRCLLVIVGCVGHAWILGPVVGLFLGSSLAR